MTDPRQLGPGEQVAETIWGEGYADLLKAMIDSLDPDFTNHINSFFEKTYTRPALDIKTRQLCTLCALASMGIEAELIVHLRGSLNLGWTQLEMRNALLMTLITGGIPRTIHALKSLNDVLTELGIEVETDPCSPDDIDHYELGISKGREMMGGASDDLAQSLGGLDKPAARHFVEDILGRLFSRPHLDDKVVALILTASCTATGNHRLLEISMRMADQVGVTGEEIFEIIYQMHGYAGWARSISAMEIFAQTFSSTGGDQ